MSALARQRGPHSEATKARMSAAHLGRPKSAQHRAAIAAVRRGTKHSPESKQKNRLAHLGKHPTPTALEHIRAANRLRSGPRHHWWGKISPHGPRTHWITYNGVSFRSSYDARFAKALDARGMTWEYEPKRFDLGTCTYLPDFFVPETGAYWELKGWFDPRSVLKIRLFRERYPQMPLIVADHTVLAQMERNTCN